MARSEKYGQSYELDPNWKPGARRYVLIWTPVQWPKIMDPYPNSRTARRRAEKRERAHVRKQVRALTKNARQWKRSGLRVLTSEQFWALTEQFPKHYKWHN